VRSGLKSIISHQFVANYLDYFSLFDFKSPYIGFLEGISRCNYWNLFFDEGLTFGYCLDSKTEKFLYKGKEISFYTVINCMYGRVQLPVINYLKERFNAAHIDSVTEAGPVLYLSEKTCSEQTKSILRRTDISINKHKSTGIAVMAHHDCAGNPSDKQTQINQLKDAIIFLAGRYTNVEISGLWVDSNWSVTEL